MASDTKVAAASHAGHVSERTSHLKVEKSLPGERLDTFLRSQFPAVSRGTIQRLIEHGYVRLNGKITKATHSPRAGDLIDIAWPQPRAAEAKAEDIPLSILYEDRDLLVINKPPGIVVHPSAGHEEHTLVNALLHHCKGQLSGIGGVARPGIVHRLDKDTSGCIVVAKNDATHLALATQFSERQLEKKYLAIVCGELKKDSGEIRASIARHPGHRKRMTVTHEAGRDARTSYRVRERFAGAAFIEVALHTGRTHQIRVHFQHLGHPIFGDELYGKRQTNKLAESAGFSPPRVMLHSWTLAFTHPAKRKLLRFEAPLPDDFRETLAALRSLT